MYGNQNRIYCGVLPVNYAKHLSSEGHAIKVMKKGNTNSMVIKTHYKKRYK